MMNENSIFQEPVRNQEEPGRKPSHTASLVLGILSIVLGLLIPFVGEVLGVIGIVTASKKRREYSTRTGLVCSIIGLALSVANHILGTLLVMSYL